MGNGNNGNEVDLLALLALMHGSSPEDLREGHMAEAINALEGAHRQAARALQDLNTAGLRRKRLQEDPRQLQPKGAAEPISATSNAQATIAVQSGEGAEISLDHRTLTHIVRPNRGRR